MLCIWFTRGLSNKCSKQHFDLSSSAPLRDLPLQVHHAGYGTYPVYALKAQARRSDPLVDVAAFAERGAHVLVGTPGRLADLVQRAGKAMDLRRLEVLVLDEADRLLDMGFRTHLDAVMQRLPKQRRTGALPSIPTLLLLYPTLFWRDVLVLDEADCPAGHGLPDAPGRRHAAPVQAAPHRCPALHTLPYL